MERIGTVDVTEDLTVARQEAWLPAQIAQKEKITADATSRSACIAVKLAHRVDAAGSVEVLARQLRWHH